MGFLNDLNLGSVEADPDALADGKYPGYLWKSSVVKKKDGSRTSWVLEYKVDKAVDAKWGDRKAQEWFNISDPTEQQKSWLKRRLESLGIPESKHDTLELDDVVGIAVTFGIKNSNGYKNVNFVELRELGATTATPASATATALEGL